MNEDPPGAAVEGSGSPARRIAALAAIDAIVDPCSRALGRPIGLLGMGMIARLDEDNGRIDVVVLPTFPTCMFRGVLEEEIEAAVGALSWCSAVSVSFSNPDRVWDETRLSDAARAVLGRLPSPRRLG
jgi:metal-sulfur cluster biosynthetic enzyme